MKPTLIIAEDIVSLRDRLQADLENEFQILDLVGNGKLAVEACEALNPQLVLMDVVMPEMSGIDATQKIHERMHVPPKVIMLSGIQDDSVVMQALAAGASDYLIKPAEAARVIEVLKSYLVEAGSDSQTA